MTAVILYLILAVLPEPASTTVALRDIPQGLLLTDGRGTGLYLLNSSGVIEVMSNQPGAGRNIVITNGSVLFKECPPGEPQRVILSSPEGDRTTLLEREYFSGPFYFKPGSFLIAERNFIREYSLEGEELASLPVTGFPARVACSGELLFCTGENGGIETLDLRSGERRTAHDLEKIVFSNITAGSAGMLLAELSSGGFIVLDSSGNTIFESNEGYFPSWTCDDKVLCSILEFDGLEPVSGRVCTVDPLTGSIEVISDDGIPIYPLERLGGSFASTDASDGSAAGITVTELSEMTHPIETDDPDAHFDVPYMHQRWDTPDWFNGSWSCGPTSCMMTVQYYMMLTPDSIWASYPSPGHWSLWGNYIPVEYTFLGFTYDVLGESPGGVMVPGAHGFICPDGGAWWNNMVDFLNQHEVSSAWAGSSWSTLTGEIDSDYPVVCSSNVLGSGHIILFNGYYTDHTVVVNDPYGDANQSGWGNYYNGKDVLYDWPGYNNGHVQIGVSQLFYARAPVPTEPDTLVDDNCRGFFKYADCRYWHRTGSGFDGNAWWTYSTAALPDTCFAEWYPVLPFEGDYDVFVYIPSSHSSATGRYRLQTSSCAEEILLNQSLYSDQWASLGTFNLDFNSYLKLGDYTGTGGQHIAFDAVRFSPAGTGVEGYTSAIPSQQLRVWPNPCGGLASILLPAGYDECQITVFDTSGRLILCNTTMVSAEEVKLDLSSLSSGVYLVRAQNEGPEAHALTRLLTVCR